MREGGTGDDRQQWEKSDADLREGSRFNRRILIGVAVVVLMTAYLIFRSLDAASAVYMEVDEFVAGQQELGDRRIRVGGVVMPGTIERTGDGLDVQFSVRGEKTTASMPVHYRGVPPDIFGPNATVFVEGRQATDGIFRADVLLTRHPDTMEVLEDSAVPPIYRPTTP